MINITDILEILSKKHTYDDKVGYDFIKLCEKNSKKIFTKHKTELQFIADYISYNYQNSDRTAQVKAAEEFIELLEYCPKWNYKEIYNYLSDAKNYQTNENLLNNLINFLFSNQRTAPFRNIIKKLISRKEIYTDRTDDQHMATLRETAIQFVNGRSAYAKLPVTNHLITILLNFSLRLSELNNFFPIILTEEQGNQIREVDNLGVIYSDLLELAILYHMQLPVDSEAIEELKKYTEKQKKDSISTNTNLLTKSFDKIKLSIPNQDIFEAKAIEPLSYTPLSENFNNLCFDYLVYIKSKLSCEEINDITIDINFGISGSILNLLNSNYNKLHDYTKLYSRFISNFNDACNKYFNNNYAKPNISNALEKISTAIFENPLPIARTKDLLLEYFNPGFRENYQNIDKIFLYKKLITSDVNQELFCDPRKAESSLMKSKSSFGDEFDAMAYTNLPGKLSFEPFLRMGAQIYTSNGSVHAYPLFLEYVQTIKNKLNKDLLSSLKRSFNPNTDTSFLYICNLRTAGYTTEVEANAEAIKVKALIDSAENYPNLGLEVVVMPANRGFFHNNQREKEGCLTPCFSLHEVISELTQIVYKNGQDFYLSQRVRYKLFNSNIEMDIFEEINLWVQSAIEDLNLNKNHDGTNRCEISMSERQQLATHFFKYTLTKKLIDKLKPHKIATPCKDCIDRGMVHFIYFKIISLITSLQNKILNKEIPSDKILKEKVNLDKQIDEILRAELHCGSLLVKARIVNDHNIGLLIHTLDRFTKGKIFENFNEFDFQLLKTWINENQPHYCINSLSTEEQKIFIENDKQESEDRCNLLLPASTELSQLTKYIPAAIEIGEGVSSKAVCAFINLVSYVRATSEALTYYYSNFCSLPTNERESKQKNFFRKI